jgi:hypothetical protein
VGIDSLKIVTIVDDAWPALTSFAIHLNLSLLSSSGVALGLPSPLGIQILHTRVGAPRAGGEAPPTVKASFCFFFIWM